MIVSWREFYKTFRLQERRRFKKRSITDKERAESTRKKSKTETLPSISMNSQYEQNIDLFQEVPNTIETQVNIYIANY